MRMLIPIFLFPFLGLIADAAVSSTVEQTHTVSADVQVSIENVNGRVSVDTWDRPEVRIVAEKRARNEAGLAAMDVKITATGSRVAVKTEYQRTDDALFGRNDSSGEVNYTVTVPASAQLKDVKTVNGNIDVTGVEGEVSLSSVNGAIRTAGLRQDARLATVNGKVVAKFSEIGADRRISIQSVNGRTEVVLPADAAFDLKASTVHGSIRNDFALVSTKSFPNGRTLKGQVGDGSATVAIKTVNGGIQVTKSGATL